MVFNKSVKRTMWMNKVKYIGMTLLIVFSTILYIAFSYATDAIKEGIDRFYTEGHVEDGELTLAYSLSEERLRDMEATYHITIEEQKSVDYEYGEDTILRIFLPREKINLITILKGGEIEKDDDILLSYDFAKANGYDVNDHLSIRGKEYNIAGLYTSPDYLYPLKSETDISLNNTTFGMVIMNAGEFGEFDEPVVKYCVTGGDKEVYTELRKEIQKDNFVLRWLPKAQNQRITNVDGTVNSFVSVGNTVPIGVLIVVCALVAVMLRRQMKVEYKKIGLLRAFGYRLREIELHYLRYSFYMAVIGCVTGILPGILLAKPITRLMNLKYAMPGLKIYIQVGSIAVNVLLTFTFLLITTFFVVKNALKMTTLELMREKERKNKVGWCERKIHLEHFHFDTKFKIREFLRNRSRSFIMLLGIMIASVLLMFGFVLNDSFEYLINDCFKQESLYNYEYYLNTFMDEKVENAEPMGYAQVETADETSFMMNGITKDARLIRLEDKSGNQLDLSKVIMTAPLARKLGIKAGDTVVLSDVSSQKELQIKIDAVAATNLGEYIYMPLEQLNQLFGYPEDSYLKLISLQKLDISSEDVQMVNDINDITDGYNSMMKPLRMLVGVMAVITFFIGVIIIYILTALLLEENAYDISLLKVFGYKNKHIFKLMINGMAAMITIGFMIGCLITIPIMNQLFAIMAADMGAIIPVVMPVKSIVIGYLVIVFTYYVSKTIVSRKVINISMVDVLKERNE